VTITASLSPVVKYHGLARRYLMPPRFLMRPLLNGGTLGGLGIDDSRIGLPKKLQGRSLRYGRRLAVC